MDNSAGYSIYQNKKLVENIFQSIEICNELKIMKTIFEDDTYTVKGCIYDNSCYYIISNMEEIHFKIDNYIPSYIEGNEIKKLEYAFAYDKITPAKIETNIISSIFSRKIVDDWSYQLEKYYDLDKKIDKKHQENLNFFDVYKITDSISSFKQMINFLEIQTDFKFNLTVKDYVSFSENYCKKIQEETDDIFVKLNFLKNICKKYDFSSKLNAFEYNDLDNYVWMEKDVLIFENQNLFYYCYQQQDNNLIVNYSVKDFIDDNMTEEERDECYDKFGTQYIHEISKMINNITNNSYDIIEETSLQIKDNIIEYAGETLYSDFNLDLTYSIKAICEEHDEKFEYPENINSPEYYIKYINYKYKWNEMQILNHTFLSIGNGLDWIDGELVSNDTKYIKNLPDVIKSNKIVNEIYISDKFNYFGEIKYLNDEWKIKLQNFYDYCNDNYNLLKSHNNIDEILASMKIFLENNKKEKNKL